MSKKPKPDAFKCRTHLFCLTPAQRDILKRWFGVYRWTYNKCCELVYDPTNPVPPVLAQLRLIVVNKRGLEANFPDEAFWVLEVPHDWRDKAVVEFIKNYDTQRRSLGKSSNSFIMSFKSKKATSQACEVDPKHWHGGNIFARFWKQHNLPRLRCYRYDDDNKSRCSFFVQTIKYAVKFTYIRAKSKFYLVQPDATSIPPSRSVCDNQTDAEANVVFIDPGVRVFITAYDSRGRVLELGVGYDKILKMCQTMDRLTSFVYSKKPVHRLSHTRYRLRNRTLPRLRLRLQNMLHDFHSKVARFLCENYTDIHLPIFESSQMLKRSKVRCLSSKTARMMCTWSHYKFQQLLRYRASVTGAEVHIANESYTSRTCCHCGHVKDKSGSKLFVCPVCNLRIDRDINGAINICLRQCSR